MTDRKTLKQDYKYLIHPKGVFIIKNIKNGMFYLGSSMNLKGIYDKNKFTLNLGSHYNKKLQEAWNTFGESAFIYEVLETVELKEDLNYNYEDDLKILELIWMDKFNPDSDKSYNKNLKIRVV